MVKNPSYFTGENFAVEQVSWEAVQEFIKKLNAIRLVFFTGSAEAQWGMRVEQEAKHSLLKPDQMGWSKENSGEAHIPLGKRKRTRGPV